MSDLLRQMVESYISSLQQQAKQAEETIKENSKQLDSLHQHIKACENEYSLHWGKGVKQESVPLTNPFSNE